MAHTVFSVLRRGSRGPLVWRWQTFLGGQRLYLGRAGGDFDGGTHTATKLFQRNNGLDDDGVVGDETLAAAIAQGFVAVGGANPKAFPARPAGLRPLSFMKKQRRYGALYTTPAPTAGNPEGVKETNGWSGRNLVTVPVPHLPGLLSMLRQPAHVQVNKAVADDFMGLFRDWDDAGLLGDILTFDGAFCMRYVRGSTKWLSSHSWGTAFDINAQWNGYGCRPARENAQGSVVRLIPAAVARGFYSGAWFKKSDAMHFEYTR